MTEYDEFRWKLLKIGEKKGNYSINNSYGAKDIYRWIKKNKFFDIGAEFTESEFRIIINEINNAVLETVLMGKKYNIPCNMGSFDIVEHKCENKIRDGKLVSNFAIDWDSTVKLWYEDIESKNNKVLIRHEYRYTYKFTYSRNRKKLTNLTFFNFTEARNVRFKIRRKLDSVGTGTLF